ncbi:hypothetical protein [Streptomyces sp. NPDC048111]|uniref:hypothetical protein n=1 Tax=Streptomyces sp. NPDC048111 TaxID=3365500 RepID=UPI0037116002
MPAPQRERSPRDFASPPALGLAEATLVEHYPGLVRLAYLVLPPQLGRHRRVLAAHAVVQGALPGRPGGWRRRSVPAQRGDSSPALDWIVRRVVGGALSYDHAGVRRRWAPRPTLPAVWGLRLTPRIGGADELALDQQLAAVPAAVRAAFVLRHLEGYAPRAAAEVLAAARVADPDAALRAAAELGPEDAARAQLLLDSVEFDPCTVQARPTDLLRRRHWRRWGGTLALVVAATLTVSRSGQDAGTSPDPAGRSATAAGAADAASLVRAPDTAWQSSARIDFTVWPARGDRTDDRGLLSRALGAWARPGTRVRTSAAPGTATTGPSSKTPQLLYAGRVDETDVVVLRDGERVVRYAETAGQPPVLDFARADNADVTTAAALVLARTGGRTRFLLAPWVAESTTRDLLRPDSAARPLHVADDGVSDAVAAPGLTGPCSNWPALQLRSSDRIAEKHAFLLTDLGDLSPVHLTYTPPPGAGAPARQPREATSGAALVSWSHTACTLRSARGGGVRAVNNWVFAEQQLPENAGQAAWLCSRADTWNGPGRAVVRFQPPTTAPGEPGTLVADLPNSSYCSRFNQHVLAAAHWSTPAGTPYLLAAGSRAVTRITVSAPVRAEAAGPTLAVRSPAGPVTLNGALTSGKTLNGVQ